MKIFQLFFILLIIMALTIVWIYSIYKIVYFLWEFIGLLIENVGKDE